MIEQLTNLTDHHDAFAKVLALRLIHQSFQSKILQLPLTCTTVLLPPPASRKSHLRLDMTSAYMAHSLLQLFEFPVNRLWQPSRALPSFKHTKWATLPFPDATARKLGVVMENSGGGWAMPVSWTESWHASRTLHRARKACRCESLNSQSLSWPAVRERLRSRYPDTLKCFTALEQIEDAKIADIRLARKAGGFAFVRTSAGFSTADKTTNGAIVIENLMIERGILNVSFSFATDDKPNGIFLH